MTVRVADDTGRVLELGGVPTRVVSLVPSLTELVSALGGADRLVGVTRFCTDPPDVVARIEKVGGTKNPSCERIVALRPEIVLANAEENRREDFERLVAAGIPVFVSFPKSVAGAARSIGRLGTLLGFEEGAAALAREIESTRQTLAETIQRRSRVFCPIWCKPWMSFNRETFAHDLLWRAGGDNVCGAARDRYPRVTLAEIAAREPEVVLLPDEPYRFRPQHLDSLRPLSATPAWREGRIHFVDGKALSWYGPRTPGALRYFLKLVAPEPV